MEHQRSLASDGLQTSRLYRNTLDVERRRAKDRNPGGIDLTWWFKDNNLQPYLPIQLYEDDPGIEHYYDSWPELSASVLGNDQ